MSGVEPSSFADADVIARLRKANAALREVVNTQAVQIETLTGQVTALSAQLAAQVARIEELERRLGSDSTTDGAGAVVDAARRGVEPGGRVSFVLPATVGSTEPPDAGLALSSVTALPTGEGFAAQYALAPGGAYVVTAVYTPGPQGAGRACAALDG